MLIERLTGASGLPGYENAVRALIAEEISGCADSVITDRLGNLIAEKNKNAGGPHIALSAHMDEVGLAVRYIDGDGYVRFASWGVDARNLPAKVVYIGADAIPGVIGVKPRHLTTETERNAPYKIEDMYIDIGALSKDEAAKSVFPGDFIAFGGGYTEFGQHKAKAKALDDRVGCALIVNILKSDMPYRITASFNAQEEVGLRGSAAAANQIKADLVINLEGTICADTSGVEEHLRVTAQGLGPAVSVSDHTSVYLRPYIDFAVRTAEENGIPYQYRRTGMGGTDAASFHAALGGTPVIGLAIPCRYIHSPVSVMDTRDFENAGKLLAKIIERFNKTGGKLV